MSTLLAPGSVVDTTTEPGWTPLRVEAVLAQPVVGIPRDPMHLDGPVQWAGYLAAVAAGTRLPPLDPQVWVHDFDVPMATWTAPCSRDDPDPRLLAADGTQVWGWACSAADYRVVRHDVVHIRRKPALEEMTRWTIAGRHHIGLGPRRAANVPHQAAWVDRLAWWCLADPEPLRGLLARVTHVGRLARHGWGQVLTWTVTEDRGASERWRARDMPDPAGSPGTIRAPYWHPSRRMPCTRRT